MFNHEMILNHIDDIFGHDMHAKRVLSLANATLGVIESGSLAIHAIGNGLSLANGLERKYAVKQVGLCSPIPSSTSGTCLMPGSLKWWPSTPILGRLTRNPCSKASVMLMREPLSKLKKILPEGMFVMVVADRGFGCWHEHC